MDISTMFQNCTISLDTPIRQSKSAKLHDFSRRSYSVSEILHKYSNSIWTTIPERESCKMTGIFPVSLRLEAKGPKMM